MKKCSSIIKVAATLLLSATVLFTGCTVLTDGVSSGETEAGGERSVYVKSRSNVLYTRNTSSVVSSSYFDYIICYSFKCDDYGNTNTSETLKGFGSSESSKKTEIRKLKPKQGILLCIGGSDETTHLRRSIRDYRSKLISNIKECVNTYGFAGVDIDWEFGDSDKESAKLFASFVKDLRNSLGSNKIISMACSEEHGQIDNINACSSCINSTINMVNVMCYGSNSKSKEKMKKVLNSLSSVKDKKYVNMGISLYPSASGDCACLTTEEIWARLSIIKELGVGAMSWCADKDKKSAKADGTYYYRQQIVGWNFK